MTKKGKQKREGREGTNQSSKRRKFFASNKNAALPLRTRGFLISCLGGKESQGAQESIRLLEEAYETLYPEGHGQIAAHNATDLAEALEDEIAGIKDKSKDVFSYNKTGIPGLVYITMGDDNGGPGPLELVAHIAKRVRDARNPQSRTLLRFLPVEKVCHASMEAIGKAAQELLPQHFPAGPDAEPLTYAVQYEHRASGSLDRGDLINKVIEGIDKIHKVNLTTPQKTIVVQVVKMCCAISVVDDYRSNLKYNLRELAMTEEERQAARGGRHRGSSPKNALRIRAARGSHPL
eukprot:jgi/Botrbrau1/14005/Bobra.150_1s0015.1